MPGARGGVVIGSANVEKRVLTIATAGVPTLMEKRLIGKKGR
jgi:hypothetical protein